MVAGPWACIVTHVDWSAEGYKRTKLASLAVDAPYTRSLSGISNPPCLD